MDVIYHISHLPDLKVIEPQISSHGVPYVYATKNLEFGLLFGTSKTMRDLDGIYGGNETDGTYFYEAYKGAFERRFKGETCYIYELDAKNFEKRTSCIAEVVSPYSEKVLKCTKVEDVYEYLLNSVNNGKLDLRTYPHEKEYRELINRHIVQCLTRSSVLANKEGKNYQFCKQYLSKPLQKIEKLLEELSEGE